MASTSYTRVAVAQLDYLPAASIERRSPLADPLFELGRPSSLLPASGDVPPALLEPLQALQDRIRAAYVEQLRAKLEAIVGACVRWKVQLLVLPEARDDAGAVQWTLDDPLGAGVMPAGLAATADGGFVMITNLYDPCTTISSVRVVRFDAEGGVVWETIHALPEGDGVDARRVAVGPDGRIGLTGLYFASGATDADAWVAVLAP